MTTYIAFLRGINVGGQKQIKMVDLKNLFLFLDFENVRTYIQSGNVVFETDCKEILSLNKKIESVILKEMGLEVSVIIRSHEELKSIIRSNPFLTREENKLTALYVTLLSQQPSESFLEKVSEYNYAPDDFKIIENEIYLYCPNGYGKTKLNNTFFENKLKLKATTRNWRTINELDEMAVLF